MQSRAQARERRNRNHNDPSSGILSGANAIGEPNPVVPPRHSAPPRHTAPLRTVTSTAAHANTSRFPAPPPSGGGTAGFH